MEVSIVKVVGLGVGMVFVGLIAIIGICKLLGLIFRGAGKTAVSAPPAQTAGTVTGTQRAEIIAAVSAAVAEELGTDVSALRIISFKKL
ncbi:MAG: OadG family protein [Clostridia bacterium]|nr:OadG family protein [Clostridia bacterium]